MIRNLFDFKKYVLPLLYIVHGETYELLEKSYEVKVTLAQINIQCKKCKPGEQYFNFEFVFREGTKDDPRDIYCKRIFHGLHYEKYHPLKGHQLYQS